MQWLMFCLYVTNSSFSNGLVFEGWITKQADTTEGLSTQKILRTPQKFYAKIPKNSKNSKNSKIQKIQKIPKIPEKFQNWGTNSLKPLP